ncbi:unnamed protein product [Closterium sp. NIES-54]
MAASYPGDIPEETLAQFEQAVNESNTGYVALVTAVSEEEKTNSELPAAVRTMLEEYKDIMPDDLPTGVPPVRTHEHETMEEPSAKPGSRAPHRISPAEQADMKKQMEYLLDKKLIWPSTSPYSAPVLFTPKHRLLGTKQRSLGHMVSAEGVYVDPRKTKAVKKWKFPDNIKELQQFLGFAYYYIRFVPQYAKIAVPLANLLKKDTPYKWGTPQQQAMEQLHTALNTAPVLILPDRDKDYVVEADASDQASRPAPSRASCHGKMGGRLGEGKTGCRKGKGGWGKGKGDAGRERGMGEEIEEWGKGRGMGERARGMRNGIEGCREGKGGCGDGKGDARKGKADGGRERGMGEGKGDGGKEKRDGEKGRGMGKGKGNGADVQQQLLLHHKERTRSHPFTYRYLSRPFLSLPIPSRPFPSLLVPTRPFPPLPIPSRPSHPFPPLPVPSNPFPSLCVPPIPISPSPNLSLSCVQICYCSFVAVAGFSTAPAGRCELLGCWFGGAVAVGGGYRFACSGGADTEFGGSEGEATSAAAAAAAIATTATAANAATAIAAAATAGVVTTCDWALPLWSSLPFDQQSSSLFLTAASLGPIFGSFSSSFMFVSTSPTSPVSFLFLLPSSCYSCSSLVSCSWLSFYGTPFSTSSCSSSFSPITSSVISHCLSFSNSLNSSMFLTL